MVDANCSSSMMVIWVFLELEPAPLAGGRSVMVPLIKLDILNWMPEAELVNACASGCASSHLHDGHLVNQHFGVRVMRSHRELKE